MKASIICIQTLCGKITPVGFGSQKDRRFLEKMRDETDATLLGATSLRVGDPEFRGTDGKIPQGRIRAIVSGSGDIPSNKRIFARGPVPMVFTSSLAYEKLTKRLGQRAKVFALSESENGELNLKEALKVLSDHGVKRLLIEGGGKLNYLSLKQGIVDEIIVTIAPKVRTSGKGVPLIHGDLDLGKPFLDLDLLWSYVEPTTGEIFVRYKVKKGE